MRIRSFFWILFFFCVSCQEKYDHKGLTPLVEINHHFLYREDLEKVMPTGLSKDDSLLFSEHYIRNWAEDILLYDKAVNNIPDNAQIDQLVENYRKSLIMHAYQQELIAQRLSREITPQEIAEYYEKNKDLFKLDRPLIRGLFIKVPLKAPQLNNVRRWYKSKDHEAVEHLEKYSLQNAVKYSYFYDKWILADDVLAMLPLKGVSAEDYLKNHRQIELKDSVFCYFLNISDYRGIGEQKPYEFAQSEIHDLLTNQKQVDFMKQVKTDLYNEAVKKEKISYNY